MSIYKQIFRYFLPRDPISRSFGFDRGKPIDRYYIERFLDSNRQYIHGHVLEIADSYYTKKYAREPFYPMIMHASSDDVADFVADLASGDGVPESIVDCFILTQTLQCIYDVRAAVQNSLKLIKSGGHLLVTVPGITQISRYDYDKWGFFWSFTDLSLQKLLEETVPSNSIQIQTYGNVKVATGFLYGMACKELSKEDLDYTDHDYQVIIAAVVRKP